MDLMSQRIEKLEGMLDEARNTLRPIMLSDGTTSEPFGMIQYMRTAGRMQYGIRRIGRGGLMGSGQYFQEGQEDDLILAALSMLADIEKPHPFTQKLIAEGRMKKSEPLGFHFLTEEMRDAAFARRMA